MLRQIKKEHRLGTQLICCEYPQVVCAAQDHQSSNLVKIVEHRDRDTDESEYDHEQSMVSVNGFE